tara:strand:- start:9976 stop:10290 length:315 start_codon:yes stop_codon:yes gene_type:complete
MEIKEAIQVLKDHNIWRRGEDEELKITDPKELGLAIDTVVNEFENFFISGVVQPLNTDKTNPNFEEWLQTHTKFKDNTYSWGMGYVMTYKEMKEKHEELIELGI